jgi:serine/threonine-protein kinase
MQVPEWILTVINKCLQKKVGDRYANGMELHDFISHHRIHTAEVLGLVKNEDTKWRNLLAKKETQLQAQAEELEELKAIVLKQDSELQKVKAGGFSSAPIPAAYNKNKTVSRSTFTAAVIIAVLAGCLAVYSLFFNKAVVGAAQTDSQVLASDSTPPIQSQSEISRSENNSTAKKLSSKERKKKVADSLSAIKKITAAAEQKSVNAEVQDVLVKEEKQPVDDNSGEEDDPGGSRYKVRNKAYFHDEPDESTRRAAFIIHWNNATLKPLDEKNGFIYVIYTNHEGQTSKGWLSKSELLQVK